MFEINLENRTIKKVNLEPNQVQTINMFNDLENAKYVLKEKIQKQIDELKNEIKSVDALTIDDVSQLGFF